MNLKNQHTLSDHQFDPDLLKNRVFLITGAAEGIGRALTLALSAVGATVLMLDKKARQLEKLSDQINDLKTAEAVILPIDLLELTAESATQLAQAIYNDIGQLDGLVHNAAELGSPSPLDQYDLEHWNTVMHVNMQAPYLLTRATLPLIKQAAASHILFCSAQEGRNPNAYAGAYGIAYAALEAQMRIWADELETTSDIKINSIDPGPVRTRLRRRSHPGEDQKVLASPQQIAPYFLKVLSGTTELHGCQISLPQQTF